jgi:mRNA-degrading endonuclease toxin of MazEF toxin-antitoxin module
MPTLNPGEVWVVDFGMTAKVRPALLLTGEPAADELDVVSVVLHTTGAIPLKGRASSCFLEACELPEPAVIRIP